MSEYAGELKVKIVPDANGFASNLQSQISGLSPRVQAMMGRTGLTKTLTETDRIGRQLATTEQELARKTDMVAQANQRTQASTLRAGAGFAVLGIAARNLTQDFSKWAEAQGGVVSGLGQIAQGVSNLDLLTTGKGIGRTAALLFQPGAGGAEKEAQAAQQQDLDRQNAIKLAQQLLDLREKTAKAEGQVGTAAGATKYQLEQQLRIAQAAFSALPQGSQNIAAASLGLKAEGGKLVGNQALAGRNPVAPTDADRATQYQLNSLRASQDGTTAQEIAISKTRRDFLTKQIERLEKDKNKTAEEKQRLVTLYGQLDSVEGSIDDVRAKARADAQERLQKRLASTQIDLQIQLASARGEAQETAAIRDQAAFASKEATDKRLSVEQRQGYELQAAQYNKQLYDIGQAAAERAKQAAADAIEQKKQEVEAEKQRYRAGLSLREQRLQLSVQAAQLTDKNLKDDKKALKAEIAYYKEREKDKKLSIQERLTAQSSKISAQLQLKSLASQAGGGGGQSNFDFYKQAVSNFRSLGSNIAGRGGILSGQDARASYASRILGGRGAQSFAAAVERARDQRAQSHLTEAQKQTALLKAIAVGIARGYPSAARQRESRRKGGVAIDTARAIVVSG